MRIIFVRHGETVENAEGRVQGHQHGTLSEIGRGQAADAARRLKDVHIDAIYSSPLRRASDTAREIARFHPDAELVLADELKERGYGVWEGRRRGDIPEWDPGRSYEPGHRPGGGETIEEVHERLRGFLLALLGKHADGTVLIVGHAQAGRVLKAMLTGKRLGEAGAIPHIENASIETFEFRGFG